MNSAGVTVSDSPTPANLFDEFEEAFQNCLAPLTKEDPLNGINQDELRVNAETNGQRFLELAHRMEAAFLQKRFLLSVQKPELLLMEENHEMRIEMGRKDELIKKQTEKLTEWQNTLVNLINRVGSVPTYGPRTPTQGNSTPSTPNHMSIIGSGGATTNQTSMPGINPATSISLVSGMSHVSNISHNMNPSITMSHPSMMGQVGSGSSNMAGGMGQGGYQSMGSMNSSGNTMHGGGMGGGGPSPIGQMGGSQGPGTMGVGSTNMSPNMGSNLGVGSGPSGQVAKGPVGGIYHTPGGAQSMGVMTQQPQGGLQGPLAYLEKTTTNIGMPEPRR